MSERSLRPDITTSQDLSEGALSYTTSINRKFKLEKILIHFSVAVSEIVTITLDSVKGSNYDTIMAKRTLVSEQDFVYRPQGEDNFQNGDEIKIECTAGTGIAYVTVKTQEVLF